MKVILYKSCILNNSYQEVFSKGNLLPSSTTSTLEYYLRTLSSYEFTIENYYYENSGELVIDYQLVQDIANIYDYNYMKFDNEETGKNNITRFCFIKSISLKNGCCYIEYEEDIWSSYSDKITNILPSYLSRSRVKDYGGFVPSLLMLPKEYESNNKLSTSFPLGESIRDAYTFVELQLYDIVSGTNEKSMRKCDVYLFYKASGNAQYDTISEIYENVERLIAQMTYTTLDNGKNYNVGNIYIIPKNMFDVSVLNMVDDANAYAITLEGRGLEPTKPMKLAKFNQSMTSLINGLTIKEFTINNNYKNLSIGTFDKQIKINNNGTSITGEIKLIRSSSEISLRLNILNEVIDITESFIFNPPLTSLIAEDFAQRKIAIEFEKYSTRMEKSRIGTSLIDNAQNIVDAIGNIILGANTNRYSSLLNEGTNARNSWIKGANKLSYDIPYLNEKENTIMAPKYSNSKAVVTNNSNMLNYLYGLVLFSIIPDNFNFVKKYVDNFGYEVFEFIDDIELLKINNTYYWLTHNITYNTLKFEAINVYGSFTNEIATELNNILSKGVKIWYSYMRDADNYTDDLLS